MIRFHLLNARARIVITIQNSENEYLFLINAGATVIRHFEWGYATIFNVSPSLLHLLRSFL